MKRTRMMLLAMMVVLLAAAGAAQVNASVPSCLKACNAQYQTCLGYCNGAPNCNCLSQFYACESLCVGP